MTHEFCTIGHKLPSLTTLFEELGQSQDSQLSLEELVTGLVVIYVS